MIPVIIVRDEDIGYRLVINKGRKISKIIELITGIEHPKAKRRICFFVTLNSLAYDLVRINSPYIIKTMKYRPMIGYRKPGFSE